MQDRYAFDIGDFSKCGLLRALVAAEPQRRLGVIWYANEPDATEATRNDGRHVSYLGSSTHDSLADRSAALRDCDPELFDAFSAAMRHGAPRSIAALERLAPWPHGTCFFSTRTPKRRRAADRDGWFRQARDATAASDLICCDPDNGMARPGSENERRPSPKHMLYSEATAIVGQGASAVLYHHFDRSAPHDQQAERLRQDLASACAPATVTVLRFRAISPRAYAVVIHPRHVDWIGDALDRFRRSPWSAAGHFSG